jgi:hypothetical protein
VNKRRKYRQSILVGRNKRIAILETTVTDNCITFAIMQKGKTIATRSTSKTQDEENAIMRLSKAVSGFSYVYVIPVPQEKDNVIKRYYKVNN